MKLINSPVTSFDINGKTIYIKHDELLHPDLSGNKARKLAYFIEQDLPHIDTLVSYGGVQSNLMFSLSALAKLKNWQFIYHSYPPAKTALQQTTGNLAKALANGMQLVTTQQDLRQTVYNTYNQKNQLIIEQGGAQPEAEYGIIQLANEIRHWTHHNGFTELAIFLPSGTGVSALYLQKNLPEFTVYTTNCVGTPEYLQQQWQELAPTNHQPTILSNLTYRFATPDYELWQTSQLIKQLSSTEFDLVYDPVGWHILLNHLQQISAPILYIHCGGLIGNLTMFNRYNYKYKID